MCVGGASIIVLLPLLLLRQNGLLAADVVAYPWLAPVMSWLALLVNVPHFMASYRMVYRSRETILKHKWASMYVPGFLGLYSAYAIWVAQDNPVWIALMAVIAGVYLAWHYTGQAWGMMATYAHLAGAPFDRTEMRRIRGGLRILLAWHVVWYFYWGSVTPGLRALFTTIFSILTQATFLAIGLGVWGLVRYWRRTGRMPPIRTLIPWAAIFIWYAAMATHPAALFWVQMAHALQYLIFPLRVEMNRTARRPGTSPRQIHTRHHPVRRRAGRPVIPLPGIRPASDRRGGGRLPRQSGGLRGDDDPQFLPQHPPLLHRRRRVETAQSGGAGGSLRAPVQVKGQDVAELVE